MTNAKHGKKPLAIAVLGCLCAALIAVPTAYAFYYVHGEETTAQSSQGVIEVVCTVDATALGEGVRTEICFMPEGSTAADCMNEIVESSNSQNGLDAIHDYSYSSLADLTADNTVEIAVYEAGSQEPGTHTTHDSDSIGGGDTVLERYDNVVFTVS